MLNRAAQITHIKKADLLFLIGFSVISINKLPVQPPHIAFLVSLMYYGYLVSKNKKNLKVSFLSFILLLLFLCLFLPKGNPLTFIVHFSSLLMFPIILEIGKNVEKPIILDISVSFIKISILFLILECFSRYIYCGVHFTSALGYLRFKIWSFMFVDSNLTAEFILILYFFCKYLTIYHNINTKKFQPLLFILCVLTISRAACAALIFSLLYTTGLKRKNNFLQVFIVRSILLAIIILIIYKVYFNILYENDSSFRSKFYFFDRARALFVFDWNKVLTGGGLGTATDFLQGRFPHNFFLLYFLEIGIVGLVLKIIYMIIIVVSTKMKGLILVVPYFIAEQAVTSYPVHYVYVVLAIIALLEMNKQYERHNNYCTYI